MSIPTRPRQGPAYEGETLEQEHLRETREWLEIALEASRMGVFDLDLTTMQAKTTLRHNQIFGYQEPVEEWSPRIFLEHVLPEDRPAVHEALDRAMETGEFDLSVRVRWPDGSVHWIRDWGRVYRDAEAGAARLIGVTEDVTDAKRAEEELEAAKREAEEASEAKSHYLAVMSHELRTPLTSVIGAVDLLESGLAGGAVPDQRERLARIRTTAWQLVSIIDDTLAVARSEAGREEVRRSKADLAELCRQIVQILGTQAKAKGLDLRLEGADHPVPARTDPGKTRQILMNLVDNAVKYTPQGEVVVRLDGAGTGEHTIQVRDTGPGVPPPDRERIFDAFDRGNGPDYGRAGAGLGLAISRRLARLLGGDVTLDDATAEGSTFTLRLPVGDGAGEAP